MAAERGFGVEAVSHQRKQFTRKIVEKKKMAFLWQALRL